ncbi:MAG: glycosyltransferase family protein [Cyclobacteriaceae bacterium]
MKFFFIVQGEGRGHLTQAISLYSMLKKNGHTITHVVVGKSKRRKLPQFFLDNIQSPIEQLNSPNFVTDRRSKSVKLLPSVFLNLLKFPIFLKSVNRLNALVNDEQPDVIVNFYDFLGGLYYLTKRPKAKHIAIAHQFFVEHPAFEFPKGRFFDKASMRLGNKLAGFGATKLLALSFRDFPDHARLTVVPPLLREKVKEQKISSGNHYLVYLVNHGYADQVAEFHRKNPDIPIHCFWDKEGQPAIVSKDKNLTFHQLDDDKFLELMASSKGYLTTAGFESVCEAMYMAKPTLMVPVKGHYEQSCNAIDATKAGAGISSEIFELDKLLAYIPTYKSVQPSFGAWSSTAEKVFIQNLTYVS